MTYDLSKRLAAELVSVLFVVAAIIGAGIMAQRLEGTSPGLILLTNSLVCGGMLYVVIIVFGSVSGGHLNPAWTMLMIIKRQISAREGILYVVAQIIGACLGSIIANIMFASDPISISTTTRAGASLWTSEFVGSFGLIAAVLGAVRFVPSATAAVVGVYIFAGYWFTGSSSFASPAATIGRAFSNSWAGISPGSVPVYIIAQLLGALAAYAVFSWMFDPESKSDHAHVEQSEGRRANVN